METRSGNEFRMLHLELPSFARQLMGDEIIELGDGEGSFQVSSSALKHTSVVRHTDGHLFRTARVRVTFFRMSVVLAVQMKGLGF
jgi:hypothetical protein